MLKTESSKPRQRTIKKENEIDSLNKSNSQFKNKAKQLKELDDLNTPQAKKILESMLLL